MSAARSDAGATVRHGVTALVGMLAIAVCKVLAMWAIARWQGAVVQGAFSLMLACAGFGAIVLAVGLDYANAYHTGRTPEQLRAVLAGTAVVGAVGTVVAPVWVMGYARLFPQVLAPVADVAWWGVLAVAAATSLTAFMQSSQATALGLEAYAVVARANTLFGVVWLALALPAARWASYGTLLAGWVATLVVVNVFYLRTLYASAGDDGRSDVRPMLVRQLGYGARTIPGSVARALNLRAGLYLASIFLSPVQVGVYGLLLSIGEVLLYAPNALSQVVLGSTSARRGAGEPPSLRPIYLALLGGGALTTLGMAVLARPALAFVFGPEYGQGGAALAVLCAAMTLHSVGLLRIHRVLGTGRPGTASAAQGVTLAVNAVAGVILAPRFGLVGIALASLLAYTAFAVFLFAKSDDPAPTPGAATAEAGSPLTSV